MRVSGQKGKQGRGGGSLRCQSKKGSLSRETMTTCQLTLCRGKGSTRERDFGMKRAIQWKKKLSEMKGRHMGEPAEGEAGEHSLKAQTDPAEKSEGN